jgi:hypothetical protein
MTRKKDSHCGWCGGNGIIPSCPKCGRKRRRRWLRNRREIEAMETQVVYMAAKPDEIEPPVRAEFRRGVLVALRWVLGQALDIPARVNDHPLRRKRKAG